MKAKMFCEKHQFEHIGVCWPCRDGKAPVKKELSIVQLKEQNQILREALEFYGDRKNWMMLPTSSHPECSSFYDVINDEHGDKRAREALKKIEEMSK